MVVASCRLCGGGSNDCSGGVVVATMVMLGLLV